MKICIITDVSVNIEHGMGRYLQNLIRSLQISTDCVYNILDMSDDDVEYINQTFDVVSVQLGNLQSHQKNKLSILDNIRRKKVATIHSVVDREVELYKECMREYFRIDDVGMQCVWGDDYQKLIIEQMDAFVFYTHSDYEVFKNYYKTNAPCDIIIPSIEYCFSNNYSNKIKKNNNLGFVARVDYRKGIIASFNAMEFLPEWNLDVFGMIVNEHEEIILKHFIFKNKNINYKGMLVDRNFYFSRTSIFLGNSLYEPFGFSHVENLFNFVVPIIGKGTGTHEMFGEDYPYLAEDSVPELLNVIKTIHKTDEQELHATLLKTQRRLLQYTDQNFKDRYLAFLTSIN